MPYGPLPSSASTLEGNAQPVAPSLLSDLAPHNSATLTAWQASCNCHMLLRQCYVVACEYPERSVGEPMSAVSLNTLPKQFGL